MEPRKKDLLETWADWANLQPQSGPFILDADREVLLDRQANSVTYHSWCEASNAHDLCAPDDSRLHLGLLPEPFVGDIRNASIYILLLNPGVDPSAYFGEYEVTEFREALIVNLQQRSQRNPFIGLDPQFAWHGIFRWWQQKLAGVTQCLANERGLSIAEARSCLCSAIASIELFPYPSPSFRDGGGFLEIPSVKLARDFVLESEFILPRVERGEAIVIVMRKVDLWNLPDMPGVIKYDRKEARGAHLSPNSRGGKAILDHLRDRICPSCTAS